MAAPVYPGDLSDGDAATAATINDRVLPIFRALNSTGGGITGVTGITDDHIDDGNIAPAKIAGVAMVLDTAQTATGDKTFTGDVNLQQLQLNQSLKRAFGSLSSGSNGGNTTNDTTPNAAGVSLIELNYGAPTTITAFDGAIVEGQWLLVHAISANITLDSGLPTDAGSMTFPGGVDENLITSEGVAILLIARFINSVVNWVGLRAL